MQSILKDLKLLLEKQKRYASILYLNKEYEKAINYS